jgi:hypothetical protein
MTAKSRIIVRIAISTSAVFAAVLALGAIAGVTDQHRVELLAPWVLPHRFAWQRKRPSHLPYRHC